MNGFVQLEQDVENFITKMRTILESDKFDINNDLFFQIHKKNKDSINAYTNEQTMIDLDFDKNDLKEELKILTKSDYMETLPDLHQKNNIYMQFGKNIKGKDIYIKVKIVNDKIVFCKSFHFAQYNFNSKFPYK